MQWQCWFYRCFIAVLTLFNADFRKEHLTMTIQFNPLEYSGELEAAGVPHAQASVHATALTRVLADVVCVRDLSKVETSLRDEIRQCEARLVCRIEQVRTDLGARIDAVKNGLNARIDAVEAKIDAVEAKIDAINARLGARIDSLSVEVNARFDILASRIETVKVELTAKIDKVSCDVASIRSELVIHRWMFGILIAMNGATLAIAVRGNLS